MCDCVNFGSFNVLIYRSLVIKDLKDYTNIGSDVTGRNDVTRLEQEYTSLRLEDKAVTRNPEISPHSDYASISSGNR